MCPHLHHLFEAFYRWNLGNEEYYSYVKMPIGRSSGNITQHKKVYIIPLTLLSVFNGLSLLTGDEG